MSFLFGGGADTAPEPAETTQATVDLIIDRLRNATYAEDRAAFLDELTPCIPAHRAHIGRSAGPILLSLASEAARGSRAATDSEVCERVLDALVALVTVDPSEGPSGLEDARGNCRRVVDSVGAAESLLTLLVKGSRGSRYLAAQVLASLLEGVRRSLRRAVLAVPEGPLRLAEALGEEDAQIRGEVMAVVGGLARGSPDVRSALAFHGGVVGLLGLAATEWERERQQEGLALAAMEAGSVEEAERARETGRQAALAALEAMRVAASVLWRSEVARKLFVSQGLEPLRELLRVEEVDFVEDDDLRPSTARLVSAAVRVAAAAAGAMGAVGHVSGEAQEEEDEADNEDGDSENASGGSDQERARAGIGHGPCREVQEAMGADGKLMLALFDAAFAAWSPKTARAWAVRTMAAIAAGHGANQAALVSASLGEEGSAAQSEVPPAHPWQAHLTVRPTTTAGTEDAPVNLVAAAVRAALGLCVPGGAPDPESALLLVGSCIWSELHPHPHPHPHSTKKSSLSSSEGAILLWTQTLSPPPLSLPSGDLARTLVGGHVLLASFVSAVAGDPQPERNRVASRALALLETSLSPDTCVVLSRIHVPVRSDVHPDQVADKTVSLALPFPEAVSRLFLDALHRHRGSPALAASRALVSLLEHSLPPKQPEPTASSASSKRKSHKEEQQPHLLSDSLRSELVDAACATVASPPEPSHDDALLRGAAALLLAALLVHTESPSAAHAETTRAVADRVGAAAIAQALDALVALRAPPKPAQGWLPRLAPALAQPDDLLAPHPVETVRRLRDAAWNALVHALTGDDPLSEGGDPAAQLQRLRHVVLVQKREIEDLKQQSASTKKQSKPRSTSASSISPSIEELQHQLEEKSRELQQLKQEKLTSAASSSSSSSQALEEELKTVRADLQARQEECSSAQRRLQFVEASNEALQKELESAKRSSDEYAALLQSKQRAEAEAESLRGKVERLESDLEALTSGEDETERLRSILQELETENATLRRQVADKDSSGAERERALEESAGKWQRERQALEAKVENLERVETENAQLREQLVELEQAVQRLESAPVDAVDAVGAGDALLQAERDGLKMEVDRLRKRVAELEKAKVVGGGGGDGEAGEVSRLRREVQRLERSLAESRASSDGQMEAEKRARSALEADLASMRAALANAREKADRARAAAEREASDARRAAAAAEAARKQLELELEEVARERLELEKREREIVVRESRVEEERRRSSSSTKQKMVVEEEEQVQTSTTTFSESSPRKTSEVQLLMAELAAARTEAAAERASAEEARARARRAEDVARAAREEAEEARGGAEAAAEEAERARDAAEAEMRGAEASRISFERALAAMSSSARSDVLDAAGRAADAEARVEELTARLHSALEDAEAARHDGRVTAADRQDALRRAAAAERRLEESNRELGGAKADIARLESRVAFFERQQRSLTVVSHQTKESKVEWEDESATHHSAIVATTDNARVAALQAEVDALRRRAAEREHLVNTLSNSINHDNTLDHADVHDTQHAVARLAVLEAEHEDLLILLATQEVECEAYLDHLARTAGPDGVREARLDALRRLEAVDTGAEGEAVVAELHDESIDTGSLAASPTKPSHPSSPWKQQHDDPSHRSPSGPARRLVNADPTPPNQESKPFDQSLRTFPPVSTETRTYEGENLPQQQFFSRHAQHPQHHHPPKINHAREFAPENELDPRSPPPPSQAPPPQTTQGPPPPATAYSFAARHTGAARYVPIPSLDGNDGGVDDGFEHSTGHVNPQKTEEDDDGGIFGSVASLFGFSDRDRSRQPLPPPSQEQDYHHQQYPPHQEPYQPAALDETAAYMQPPPVSHIPSQAPYHTYEQEQASTWMTSNTEEAAAYEYQEATPEEEDHGDDVYNQEGAHLFEAGEGSDVDIGEEESAPGGTPRAVVGMKEVSLFGSGEPRRPAAGVPREDLGSALDFGDAPEEQGNQGDIGESLNALMTGTREFFGALSGENDDADAAAVAASVGFDSYQPEPPSNQYPTEAPPASAEQLFGTGGPSDDTEESAAAWF